MLDVVNLEVVYDRVVRVLDSVSLQVPEGRVVALPGANGAGRSTVLRAISGLLNQNAAMALAIVARARSFRDVKHYKRRKRWLS